MPSMIEPFEYVLLLGAMAVALIWGVAAAISRFFTRK